MFRQKYFLLVYRMGHISKRFHKEKKKKVSHEHANFDWRTVMIVNWICEC